MKSFGRFFMIILLIMALGVSSQVVSAQDQPVTLNLWMFLDNTGFLQSVVKAFEAKYPNITIQITDVPEDSYTTKIDTAILAGQPPDIGFPYVQRWIKAGYMLPIDDVLAAQKINIADYNAGAISRNCLVNNHLYCLGTFTGGTALFYNKDMFDTAKIPYPSATEPMTIDQYVDMVNKLYVPNDDPAKRVWGGNAPAAYWFDLRDFFSEDGKTATGYVNNDTNIHTFQAIADLIKSGKVVTNADLSTVSPSDLMVSGQLAMAVTDTVIAQPELENAKINWGAAPPPVEKAGDPPWVYTGSDELGVFSGSAHPDEAKLFIAFYGTEGNAMRLAANSLPLNMKMAEDQNWAGDSEGRKEMLAAIETSRASLFIPDWPDVISPLDDMVTGMVEDGTAAKDALDQTAPIIQDNLDQAWDSWNQVKPNQ